jgi:hypothetical protein
VPAIRYPIFWLVGGVLLLLGWWVVWPRTAGVRAAIHERWRRVVEGPPVPSSDSPQVIAGPMVRRILLLRNDVPATDRPDGRVAETIGRRVFADVYDVWPLDGEPTHYRVGNRRAFGWVPAADVLPWNTRLVLADDGTALPVVGWGDSRLQVARWAEGAAWQRVGGLSSMPADSPDLGVLLSRDELAFLLRRLIAGEGAEELRLRAILGRLVDRSPWTADDLAAVRKVLPATAVERRAATREAALAELARLNRDAPAVAGWAGLEFQLVPLDALP